MTVFVLVCLAALTGWAVYHSVRKAKRGGGCCGEHEAAERKSAVKDRNKSHYPYEASLRIGGMTCQNCARRVENALNGLDGVWAAVKISDHSAAVRCKTAPSEQQLREAVRQAGYVVTEYAEKRSPAKSKK